MNDHENVVAAYKRHKADGPLTAASKARIIGAMARAGDLTLFGARVYFLEFEGALPENCHFDAPPPWVYQDPHYISPRKLRRMVDAYDGSWGSALRVQAMASQCDS